MGRRCARTVKILGPTFWLVGSSEEPPAGSVAFNNPHVLLMKVPGRQAMQPILQASGPVPTSAPATHPSDLWDEGDPWSDTARVEPAVSIASNRRLSALEGEIASLKEQ